MADSSVSNHYLQGATSTSANDIEQRSSDTGSATGLRSGSAEPKKSTAIPRGGDDDDYITATHKPVHRRICGIELTRRRKIMLFVCCGLVLLLTAIMIPILVFVIAPLIAQSSIDSSVLNLGSASITSPTNSSFLLTSSGSVTNAGFLDATLSFPNPISIYWTNRPENQPDLILAYLNLPNLVVSGAAPKGASLSLENSMVTLDNPDNMGTFSKFLIQGQNFSWRLVGTAKANALGMNIQGLKLNKVVTLA
ncbi:hypothetical protein HDU76_010883, partial [Blyttiomyces sp. JEL0837]